ncbi:hypothetical protein [uncultured Bacteroides sp.]|uniref:hypothetical protein n=1 Tax=uncultured Bacteroides sp. TaxID=162156 RepID=UPI002599223A|nr:hypothetical protein [uncultured Bacteroides sp.]
MDIYINIVSSGKMGQRSPAQPDRRGIAPRSRGEARAPGLGRTAGGTTRRGRAAHTARRSRKEMSQPRAWVQGTMLSPTAVPTGGSAGVDTKLYC